MTIVTRGLFAACAPSVAAWLLASSCGGPAKEGGAGADCFRVSDCQAGLVCIDHKCTSDLTSIVMHEDAGVNTAATAVGAGGAAAGAGGSAGGSLQPGGSGGQPPTPDAAAE